VSEVPWGQYARAYQAIHEKMVEVLAQLSTVKDPARYLPVRLTDGSAFYDAGGGAGGLSQVQVRDAANVWRDVGYYAGNLNMPVEVKNAIDLIDKADRVLGRVYGGQGQQLKQRATTYELIVQLANAGTEIDPRQIRALTSGDVVSAVKSGAWNIDNLLNPHPVKIEQNILGFQFSETEPTALTVDTANLYARVDAYKRLLVNVAATVGLKASELNIDAEKDLQVDAKTLPSLPAGNNNIGDVDVVSLPSIPVGSNTIGNVNMRIDKTLKTAKIDHAVSGDNTIVATVTGKRIKVYVVVLVVSGAVNCKWKSGFNDLSGDMNFDGKGEGYGQAVQPPAFLLATNAGEALILNLSAAVAVDGYVSYWDDDST